MSQTAKEYTKPVLVADEDAQSLPAWLYYDQDFFDLEREKIFLPAWHLVGHVNELQNVGDYLTFKMFNEIAFVVRDKDGAIRGFHNVCRHRAARMVDGDYGNCGRNLVCPYHAWTYQLDGTLTGVPYLEQYENFNKEDHGLTPVETDVFEGLVFIRFVPGGPSLKDYMTPVAEEMKLYRVAEMNAMRAPSSRLREVNWKNATDNYVDALHIRVAHHGLHGLLGDSYTLTVDDDVHKIFAEVKTGEMASLSNNAYRKILPHVDHLPEERQHMWTYYKLWPTLMFDVYADQIDFMQFIPLTPTSCILRENVYALDDDRREMKLARYLNLRINRNVNREDKDLIERVQEGMGSMSFEQGPLGTSEICLRHFAKQMRDAIPIARAREKPSPEEMRKAFKA
ncbi:aromatic ring-hydroxylating oxygenase subunit alpha [Hyphococcus luteus]|uniref:Aromatic ring-hydroxylating dioxygenase subunit alpha n=1 Tax=Hyphococcus luteus TaxID=2058213 RepID=A0A2S7KA20_9PROT|nr:aromatic ring-hydroxylating dioxygenase subunit alpha [Marinicaulis flavus]PQA89337.1 aromatic ring-hydroxylating dioxygenase subunit alpha [Marinicaulis flavus]